MPPGEFPEWLAEARIEPWGDELTNLAQASIRCTFQNMWRGAGTQPADRGAYLLRYVDADAADEEAASVDEGGVDRLFAKLDGQRRQETRKAEHGDDRKSAGPADG